MNEQNRKQIILAAVLGVVLVGVLIKQFVLAPGSASSSAAKGGTPAAQAGKTAAGPKAAPAGTLQQVDIDIEALIKSVEVEPIDYAASITNSRDPMRPLVGSGIPKIDPDGTDRDGRVEPADGQETNPELDPNAPPKPPVPSAITAAASMRVTGIVWDVSFPVAVVDDEVVSVGHVFPNGTQVFSIEPSRVILKVGDATIPIELKDM